MIVNKYVLLIVVNLTIINAIPNAEKVSVETVDKLLKYKNAVMCFMSCGNIYIILEKYENLLKEKEKVTN